MRVLRRVLLLPVVVVDVDVEVVEVAGEKRAPRVRRLEDVRARFCSRLWVWGLLLVGVDGG